LLAELPWSVPEPLVALPERVQRICDLLSVTSTSMVPWNNRMRRPTSLALAAYRRRAVWRA
jgi:hypothetical protein